MTIRVPCPCRCGGTIPLDMSSPHQHAECNCCGCVYCLVFAAGRLLDSTSAKRMAVAHLN